MTQAFTDFVDYVRGLDWTPEQIQFLAIVVAVPITLWIFVRLLTWPFRSRARRRGDAERAELLSRLRRMDEKQSDFEQRVTRLGIEERNVSDALEQLAAGRVSALSSSAEAPLVASLDAALVRRLDVWLRERGPSLVDNVLGRFVQERMRNLSDHTREELQGVVDSMAKGLLEAWMAENPEIVRQYGRDSFTEIARERYSNLPIAVKAPLYAELDAKLISAIEGWLGNENDRNFVAAAEEAFRGLLNERFSNLPGDLRDRLSAKCDGPLTETIEGWLEDEDDQDVRNAAEALFRKVLEARGTALADETRVRLGEKLDKATENIVSGWLDDGEGDDLTSHAENAFRTLLQERHGQLSPETRTEIGKRIDSSIADIIGEWIDNGSDDEDLNAHAASIFRSILAERLQSLPPATKEIIGERIDTALGSIVDVWLDDPSDNEEFSEPASAAFRAMVRERLDKLPEHVRARVQKSIDDAFKNEAQRMLDDLEDDDELTGTMRAKLRAIASGKSNW